MNIKLNSKKSNISIIKNDYKKNKDLYFLFFPVLIYYLVFKYIPLYGAIISFKDYIPAKGIIGSPWVGMKHFSNFFHSSNFWQLMRNTLRISLSTLIFGFPIPIILALLLNELRNQKFGSVVKTVSYIPHFISLVVICAMVSKFVSSDGMFGRLVNHFTGGNVSLLNNPKYFTPIYVISNIWQTAGWGSIIYIAALSGVDQQLYEAAQLDGAGKWKQMLHVTLPCILPTIVIMLIMRIGQVMSLGYEKIILLYNPMTYETADVISSYVYRKGLQEFSYSFSSAVGLFNSVLSFILVIAANKISKKVTNTGLF